MNQEDSVGIDTKDNDHLSDVSTKIQDLGRWKIDNKLRDLLVEKGPIRDDDISFLKDRNPRHLSTSYYIRKLPNRKRHERRWLIYSKDFDKVHCFCCKLFNTKSNIN